MTLDVYDRAPETKSGIPHDAVVTHGDLMRLFEAFKADNDARIATLDRKGTTDVVAEEKLARINAALDAQQKRLDDLALKAARPALDAERKAATDAGAREHKAAFDA